MYTSCMHVVCLEKRFLFQVCTTHAQGYICVSVFNYLYNVLYCHTKRVPQCLDLFSLQVRNIVFHSIKDAVGALKSYSK